MVSNATCTQNTSVYGSQHLVSIAQTKMAYLNMKTKLELTGGQYQGYLDKHGDEGSEENYYDNEYAIQKKIS